ncbi:MAG: hypothetical protein ACI9EF_003186 [Pseudohongiellaceae bacterium]|jgi:hypothetical protein
MATVEAQGILSIRLSAYRQSEVHSMKEDGVFSIM